MGASTPSPNPRRVAAGKLNRQRRRGLTPEGRELLRRAALAGRPWLHSTGPRSVAGKALVALNGKRRLGGEPSAREVRRQVAAVGGLATSMVELRRLAQRPQRGGELDRE